jgi:hypothetical protein
LIEVIGQASTSEYHAACAIKAAILELWPEVESSPQNKDHVVLSAGAKIHGYQVSDLDIVICGVFHGGRSFVPTKPLTDRKGTKHFKEPVNVHNFVAVIEVKDHDRRGVQFVGNTVQVRYKGGWHDATDQNEKQLYALSSYLKDKKISSAWVYRTLFMRGLPSIDLAGTLPRSISAEDFFTSLASINQIDNKSGALSFRSGEDSNIRRIINLPILKKLVPTGLDRKRMDLILRDTPEAKILIEMFGQKMIRLRGQGGTGKTIMLLQAAWRSFSEKGSRTIVLTYNHALAADIRRLLSLMGVPSNPYDGGIFVGTVMSFMYSWFNTLELLGEEDDSESFEGYSKHCKLANEMITKGAISAEDIKLVKESRPDTFDFDYVVVDESQDWPQAEADLLKSLYDPLKITIGDGVDQLVRGPRTNWEKDISADEVYSINLDKTHRMKSNLTEFARRVATEAGLPNIPQPSDRSGGGQLYLSYGSFESQNELLDELTNLAKSAGNAEIDFLICVPPSAVETLEGIRRSDLGAALRSRDLSIWDGVNPTTRKEFPSNKSEYRIVQYDSCRGLEGWVTVLDRLDEAWLYHYNQRKNEGLTEQEKAAYCEIENLAASYAWQRVMIALCRPIDSLVITLSAKDNPCSEVIRKVSQTCEDFLVLLEEPKRS